MEDIKWSDNELLVAYKDTNDDLNLLASEIRRRGITWQTLASYNLKPLAMMGYYREKRCTLNEGRAAVEAYISEQKKAAVQKLCRILRQSSK